MARHTLTVHKTASGIEAARVRSGQPKRGGGAKYANHRTVSKAGRNVAKKAYKAQEIHSVSVGGKMANAHPGRGAVRAAAQGIADKKKYKSVGGTVASRAKAAPSTRSLASGARKTVAHATKYSSAKKVSKTQSVKHFANHVAINVAASQHTQSLQRHVRSTPAVAAAAQYAGRKLGVH